MVLGNLIQLSSVGSEDRFLYGNPQMTHFKKAYMRSSNFAINYAKVPFTGNINVDFGREVKFNLPFKADLLGAVFFKIKFSDLIRKEQFNNISSLTINSVCPLVTKVHHEAKKFSKENTQIIYVGHKNHDEAKGAIGVSPENMHLVESIEDVKALEIGNDVALLAQTTLALSEWEPIMKYSQERFNGLKMPRKSDLCYATTNRQETILEILPEVNTVLVVGSENSSNTKALVSMVNNQGVEAYRVDNVNDIENLNLKGNIAITAGASAPDHLVYEIIDKINPLHLEQFRLKEEDEYFPLPQQLRSNIKSISDFLSILNISEINPTSEYGINNDKKWTATQALNSL